MATKGHMFARIINSRYLWPRRAKFPLNLQNHFIHSYKSGPLLPFCVSSEKYPLLRTLAIRNATIQNSHRHELFKSKRNFTSESQRNFTSESQRSGSILTDKSGQKDSGSSKEKDFKFLGVNKWIWGLAFVGISFTPVLYYIYFMCGAPEKDEEGNEIPDEFSDLHWTQAHFWRALKFLNETKKEIEEPSFTKLLPDPLKEPYYQPPYTVVIELVDVLVHPDWQWSTGWRFKKRPGVDYFLQTCGYPRFEMVIYTKEAGMTAFPVVDQLDQKGHINYRLFRDATRYDKGVHKKDITCLNRDPSKIIVVDCDPSAVGLSPRNAILLKKWNGDDDDRGLFDLATLLTVIGSSGVDDVRTVLDSYHEMGGDILEQFKERQKAYLEMQEKMKQTQQETSSKGSLFSKYSPGYRR